MAILDLRSADPASEPEDEPTPSETPPGLDAIRAWLRKPRPWLRGIWLWVRWILSGPPEAYRWLKRHWPRAARRLRAIAAEGTLAGRVLRRIGKLLHGAAERIDAAALAFRDPRGELRAGAAELEHVGGVVRRLGERVTLGARLVQMIVSVLNRLADLFPPEPPPDGGVAPEGRRIPEETPAPPKPTPPAPAPEKRPAKSPPKPGPSPAPPPEAEAERPPETPDAPPRETPPLETPALETPPPATPPPETPAPETPPPPAPPTPALSPEAAREARLEGLPAFLHPRVDALGQRTPRDVLHPLILDICRFREWSTPAELARWLDMHQDSLVQRHLKPLVDAGLLELRYPERPNHRHQAYRTRSPD